jgi:hypothetical protein
MLALSVFAQSQPTDPDKTVIFETKVLPIFQANCVPCHGSAVRMRELDLSTFPSVLKGGDDGPVVIPGKPQESRLYQMVERGTMPKGGKPLTPSLIASIREWIEAGARSASAPPQPSAGPVTENDVLPIFLLRCSPCHGPRREEGGLALHTRAAIMKGGKSGKAIVPGRPEDSLIAQKLRSGEMPPKLGLDEISTKRITKPEIDRIVAWIAQGAPEGKPADAQTGAPDPLVSDKDRQFWAFQPPARPAAPAIKNRDRVRNPIDLFVLSKLEAKGLSFAPEAGELMLIRRAYFEDRKSTRLNSSHQCG